MKKLAILSMAIPAMFLMSFSVHKFYVSIYKIDHSPSKKRLEITARIFVDDLNAAIGQKYSKKVYFGEPLESDADVALFKKYLSSHLRIKVNGKPVQPEYLSHEYESTVFIAYIRVSGVDRVKSMEIANTALTDYVTDQQNIIQTTVNGQKSSAILTADHPVERFSY